MKDYRVRYMKRVNGQLETEIDTFTNVTISKTQLIKNCKMYANSLNWRFLDLQEIKP